MSTPDQNQNQYIVATPPTNQNGTDPKTAATALKITAFLVFTPLVLLVIAWIVGSLLQDDDGDLPDRARAVCEQSIENKLKAPATAKHNRVPDIREAGSAKWNIYSYTDAENSFGAMIRNEWVCYTAYNPIEDSWSISTSFTD